MFDRVGAVGSGEGKGGWGNKLSVKIDSVSIGKPMVSERAKSTELSGNARVFPSELQARERLTSYRGRMTVKIVWSINDGPEHTVTRDCGLVPVMVRVCTVNFITNRGCLELVRHHEEADEFGGYFIVNGNERIVRYLILPRRNHVVSRPPKLPKSWCLVHRICRSNSLCSKTRQSSLTNTLHFSRTAVVCCASAGVRTNTSFPSCSSQGCCWCKRSRNFEGVIMRDYENTYLTDRVELLLRSFKTYSLYTREQCLEYLGDKFRVVLGLREDMTNAEVGSWLIKKVLLVHLDDSGRNRACSYNPDSPQHQEVLLPGSLYGMIVKERLEESLNTVRGLVMMDVRNGAPGVDFTTASTLNKVMMKVNFDVGARLSNFLATGNLSLPVKLNWHRYISHFRCIHRGAFFTELKTTTNHGVFLCPVHTPDGSPCGLLNHLTRSCRLVTEPLSVAHIPALLYSRGLTQPFSTSAVDGRLSLCVQLDGKIIGWARPILAKRLADDLRVWKTEGQNNVPLDLEIGWVPPNEGGQYPGLFLFSNRARMMRPVIYMDIAVKAAEIEKDISTHVELSTTNFMSILANMTPFSDFNQSPRNIYQCQMGKQSMGTPATALRHRTDNKLYRLQTGQTPIVRPALHNTYAMDSFPNGMNAVVAVISYTGYDMEDAMILNKSAHERGFGYGSVYKSQIVDLADLHGPVKSTSATPLYFGLGRDVKRDDDKRKLVDPDGLPLVGAKYNPGDPIAAYIDDTSGRTKFVKYKGDEIAYVDSVRLLGSDTGETELQKIHIMLRIPRAPVIGDKFSSRHGQKGVCSQKWPAIDMPFSESGIQPDVIINPHAFPSRMTIGMLVESMAGKAGAMHGIAQDATPFQFSEDDTAVAYFGEQLRAAGYNYYGNEPMYSGITGEEFAADIYFGVVYYQRLRHMVNDKFQVRTTGPVDKLTRQPVKRAGGIRFGEMERDALIAHGTSFLLQDRLMNCSDYSTAIISLGYEDVSLGQDVDGVGSGAIANPAGVYCRVCRTHNAEKDTHERKNQSNGTVAAPRRSEVSMTVPRRNLLAQTAKGADMDVVALPYVFRYLCAELACMGIAVSLEVQ
ncbi:beta and beta-prime subunits of DNA dependent RNA-polymerase [Auriculariales sp. MPI-PUGE-AT-0066]|nr:beta and beta-prime subunits of DNA dependent RNA-polymerase [Auriculariales sp. MPI-PUGE-AT-0066]